MHCSEDGELQQCCRESMSKSQNKSRLLTKQFLHGILQAQVQNPVFFHKIWKTKAGLQELLNLRGEASK